MQVHSHYTIDQLQHIIKTEKNPYLRTRLHAIALAQKKQPASQIAFTLGYCERIIFKWVKNYNAFGIDGLLDKPGRGKPPLFTNEADKEKFCKILQAGPTDNKSCFHGKDIKAILENEFGKVRSLSDVYYLLHSLGYEWLSPRPKHYLANSEQQAEFKKKSKTKSRKLNKRTPSKRLQSGLRMRRV